MALNSLFCADVPLSNYSLTLAFVCQLFALKIGKIQVNNCRNYPF